MFEQPFSENKRHLAQQISPINHFLCMVIFDVHVAHRLRLRKMLFNVRVHTSKCADVQAIRRAHCTSNSVMRQLVLKCNALQGQ